MLNDVTYTKAEIQSTALHLIELLRRQFLANSPKITNQLSSKVSVDGYFNLKRDIFLKTVPQ